MIIELINTGTELVLGDTVNTNAAWVGQRLAALGLQVARQTIVPDGAVIEQVIQEAAPRADLLILTGGLGPTNDDLTRESAASVLGLPLELDEPALEHLQQYFRSRNKQVDAATQRQAMVPTGGIALLNANGTAPGLYLPASCGKTKGLHCAMFLLPGPPRELKPMFENQVEPILKHLRPDLAQRSVLYLKVTGLGESEIVNQVEKDLEAIPGLELGYCLGRGDCDVRLAGQASVVEQAAALVRSRIGDCILSEDRRLLEEVIVHLLKERHETVATAESCTGGMLASRLTDISGASAVIEHGFVTYSNNAKTQHLGVAESLIAEHGAVSEPVAKAMAEGCLQRSGATHALALTGIAGPTGGSDAKPVGTVFIALASCENETVVKKANFPGARDRFKMLSTQAALEMLRRRLVGLPVTR
jgi:nicotinamide-nucleotide amidase